MTLVIGIDEVGRGALAGPVVVGACALPEGLKERQVLTWLYSETKVRLTDSKKLSAAQRARLAPALRKAFIWGLGQSEVAVVDAGLTQSLRLAADAAIAQLLTHAPAGVQVRVLADAGLFHSKEACYPTKREVKADARYIEVAAASVLAKVYRDELMQGLAAEYAHYGFSKNVGYGTAQHVAALTKWGLSDQHRHSFCQKFLQSPDNAPMM